MWKERDGADTLFIQSPGLRLQQTVMTDNQRKLVQGNVSKSVVRGPQTGPLGIILGCPPAALLVPSTG